MLQCELIADNTQRDVQVSWIPVKYAAIGKAVELKDAKSGDWQPWIVTRVYFPEMPYEYIRERGADHKRQRQASDV